MMSGPGGGMEGTLSDNAEGGRRISHVNFNLDRERKLDRETCQLRVEACRLSEEFADRERNFGDGAKHLAQ